MPSDNDMPYLAQLSEIEAALIPLYEQYPTTTDAWMMMALSKSRVALKQAYGYGKGRNGTPDNEFERSVIDAMVRIGRHHIDTAKALSLDEFDKCVDKICRSVDTHRQHGLRGYYEFITHYI
jgi:hypothetical protein